MTDWLPIESAPRWKLLCLARAYKYEPLRRVVVGAGHRLVYVVHPDLADDAGDAGIGFPDDSVFVFDANLYDQLRSAWEAGEQAQLWALWQTAKPLARPLPSPPPEQKGEK